MKNKIFLMLLVTGMITACSDSFLDLTPNATINDETYYTSEEAADAAVIAAYDVLHWAVFPDNNFNYDMEISQWVLNDCASDDAITGGDNLSTDQPSWQEISDWSFTDANLVLSVYYKSCYIGIFRANLALNKIPGIAMDENKKERLLGEAKFLRAVYFFRLVNTYGEVPLVDHLLTNADEWNMPKSPTSKIWALIESDLTDAALVLPQKKQLASADMGRATKGAALTLLAKSYLFQEKWAETKNLCEQVINSNQYSLFPDFYTLFYSVNKNNVESIFEIQHMPPAGNWVWNTGDGNGNQGSYAFAPINWRGGSYTDREGTNQYKPGWIPYWGFSLPTQSLYDEFEPGDPRISRTLIQDGDSVLNPEAPSTYLYMYPGRDEVQGSRTGYYARKYEILPTNYATGGDFYASDLNWIVLRLADVYLMHAEAAYQTGDEGAARQSLEMVRARARASNNSILPEVTASGDALLQAIRHERRVELALEQHRLYDIKRWKIASAALSKAGKTFDESRHYYFPLPLNEIQIIDGVLKQNSNY